MEFQQLSGRQYPRFSGIKTFFRLPVVDDLKLPFDVALIGIPFDGGVSYRPGARFAPSAIREASSLGRGFHLGKAINFLKQIKVADAGDCPVVPIDLVQTYKQIEGFIDQLCQNQKRIIAVGGDHSTTLPVLRSLKKKYGQLRLIHFDAHFDTYPAAWGCEYHHGAFLRHAIEEGLLVPGEVYQFGIRGPLAGGEDLDFVKKHLINVFQVDDVRRKGIFEFCQGLPNWNDLPTYISFDIDCLDPSFAPGTGTPVVGGLTTYETQQILRHMKIPHLVGADVVEVCPAYDHSDITSLAAVDTLFELLTLMAQSISSRRSPG
jgi:guanidinopropionase